jgi:hypothetical protein
MLSILSIKELADVSRVIGLGRRLSPLSIQ